MTASTRPGAPALHHLALRVTDLGRAEDFYAGLLGLPLRARHHHEDGTPRALWLDLGPGVVLMLELALRGRGESHGSAHLLALAVDDLAAWERRLAGAHIPIDDRSAYTLFVRDPDGNRVGLSVYRFDG